MILTQVKLFQELMEFIDSESAVSSRWSREYLKQVLDEKAKNLTPKKAKDMNDEELDAFLTEVETFAEKLSEELNPYLKEKTKRTLYGFADQLANFLEDK